MTGTNGRALVLDFGGVVSRTMFETHRQTELALGLSPGKLTWMGPFAPQSDPLWSAMQHHEITERDYWLRRTVETGKLIGENWTRIEEFVRAARGADPQSIVRPEALAAIGAAKRDGCKLAILSNELDLFYGKDFRSRLPLLMDFDVIVDATYTAILKPDSRAYQSVCDSLDIAPRDCVFVDDQLRNVEGAQAIGMVAVHFDVTNPSHSYRQALDRLGIGFPLEA